MTDEQIETLSKSLISVVEEWFKNPVNAQEYEKWLEKRTALKPDC